MSRSRTWLLVVAVAVAASCTPATPPRSRPAPAPAAAGNVPAVEAAFQVYRSALLAQDGEAAAESVSSTTIAMYQEYRDLAVSGDQATLKKLSMASRMQVLLVRHRVEPARLKRMDGRALFAYAVDQNWIGKDAAAGAGLADVAVDPPRATARMTAGGKPTGGMFHFVEERGRWKLDLAPTVKDADQVLQRAAREAGMSDDELILSVVGNLSGRPVTDAIWRPLE